MASERASSSESVFSDESDRGKKYYYKWDSHPTFLDHFLVSCMQCCTWYLLASLVLTTVTYGVYGTDTVVTD